VGAKRVATLVVLAAIAACGGGRRPDGPAHVCTFFEQQFHTGINRPNDLLFVIDNSRSMGDKAALLATALPDLLNELVNPDCVDVAGNVVGASSAGRCAMGRIAHPPVGDLHVAIITASLGAAGGDLCGSDAVGAHQNDHAQLVNRVGSDEHSAGDAEPSHLLAWFSSTGQALSQPPPVPALTEATRLVDDFADMIGGVHNTGCAFEEPLESAYRFLVQPDPYDRVEIVGGRATLVDVDATLLRQRHDFLRPGSLLQIVVVTDKEDASVDPLAFGAEAWQFSSANFPGSPARTAPRATTECTNPRDPGCTSCVLLTGDPTFAARCPSGAFLDPSEDAPALRFFDMKQRFGVDALFPVSRYVRGFTAASVPDRDHEHDATGAYVGGDRANCTNPIFARDLPTDPGADLCHLPRGPRTPDLVQFSVIGGVPHQLLQTKAGIDADCPAGTSQADCPPKAELTEADWQAITGRDPEHDDFSGIDPHMLESREARAGLPPPSAADNADPITGREWTTHGAGLELACSFQLPVPKQDCTPAELATGCDCGTGGDMPVCDAKTGAQIRGKAYPSIREADVAHAMANTPAGIQGSMTSLCPIHAAESTLGDPVYAFRPVLSGLADRLHGDELPLCLAPQPRDANGALPCIVLAMLPRPGDESMCAAYGLEVPEADVLDHFQQRRLSEWRALGGEDAGTIDPFRFPMCLVPQLVGADLVANGSCDASPKAGWCAVAGVVCEKQLDFTSAASPTSNLAGAWFTVACSQGC
jgi:hypothetical protein